jgi:hypothetical protein
MPTCDTVNDVKTPSAYSGIREYEPVAPAGELVRQIAVPRHDGRQPREVGERGIRGQGQDDHRHPLDEVVEQAASEHLPCELGDDRLLVPRRDLVAGGQDRDAQEQRDHDQAEDREHGLRVVHLGRLEGGRAVRHRLDPVRATAPETKARRSRNTPSSASGGGGGGAVSTGGRPQIASAAKP